MTVPRRPVPYVACLISLVGCAVAAAWFLDIAWLKNLYDGWPAMKFTTALGFILTGMLLYLLDLADHEETAGVPDLILPMVVTMLLFVVLPVATSYVFPNVAGLERLFIPEGIVATESNRPSLPTILSFVLLGLLGISFLVRFRLYRRNLLAVALIIAGFSLTALIGYVLGIPALHYTLAGFSKGMGFHTAILFLFTSFCLVSIRRNDRRTAV